MLYMKLCNDDDGCRTLCKTRLPCNDGTIIPPCKWSSLNPHHQQNTQKIVCKIWFTCNGEEGQIESNDIFVCLPWSTINLPTRHQLASIINMSLRSFVGRMEAWSFLSRLTSSVCWKKSGRQQKTGSKPTRMEKGVGWKMKPTRKFPRHCISDPMIVFVTSVSTSNGFLFLTIPHISPKFKFPAKVNFMRWCWWEYLQKCTGNRLFVNRFL